jgi:hypothetical protein
MVKRFAFLATLLVFVGAAPLTAAPTGLTHSQAALVAGDTLPLLFSTEDSAQAHCPRDIVVWLNIPSGIYHYKSERWYGRTKHGAYACEKEAIAAGDRASENGQ